MEETRPPGEHAAESETGEPQAAVSSKPKRKRSRPLELIETVVVAFLLAIMIRATLAEARFIPSGSMIPSLLVGDRLIVEKLSYYFKSPERGEIVVFYPPDSAQQPLDGGERLMRWLGFTREAAYIKRVVALPGETIEIKQGQVLIDGQVLDEPYIKGPPIDEMGPRQIPPNHYFMMGDNRNNSRDSRVWGTLPRENVIGKTFLRFWPVQRLGMP
ncbi:MAG: signal peptidase I [Candidatus Melainabacteria bacterium HGW-Melainabacteria-1]|nr:MAG: signal peptidase I [Candidatus Melainabacteria bacterium HGW-Melainabacteria-1]